MSAFAQLLDNCALDISQPQYIQLIASTIGRCLQQTGYTTRNMVVLLDALGTLCWTAREHMNTDQVRTQLFDPLWQKVFPTMADDNPLLPHLMTCLRRCVEGLATLFTSYLPHVYPRLLAVIGSYWQGLHTYRQAVAQGQIPDPPEYNHCCYALRLMGCIISELKDAMRSPLIDVKLPGVEMSLLQLAFMSIDQGLPMEVDRSVIDASVCFLGEAIKTYPDIVIQQLMPKIPILLSLIDKDDPCSNNCVWFCGEIAVALSKPPFAQQQAVIDPSIGQMANVLVPIIVKEEWYFQILQNTAIACGKCGLAATALMAPQLGSFLKPMCKHLQLFPDHPVKWQAWEGIVKMLKVNFVVMQDPLNIQAVALAMAGTRHRPSDGLLTQQFIDIVHQLHQAAGAQWPQVRACFPANFPAEVMRPVDPSWSIPPPPPGIPPPRGAIANAVAAGMSMAASC